MPGTLKKGTRQRTYGYATVSDKVKSYADDPYFVKKAEEAKEFIRKVGLPGAKKK